jgi:hypothetical protein
MTNPVASPNALNRIVERKLEARFSPSRNRSSR